MKRTILAIILVLGAVFCAYGQNNPIDLVLLLNTSSDMGTSYENVNNYITGPFLREFLRVGDTFHLISFSDNPRLDVARRISANGDVETIIGRMLLQYPIESGNNISSAISFAEQYINGLPARPKKIVMVSTGGSDVSSLVTAANQRLSSRNTTFDFVRVTPGQPLANLPQSGRPAATAQGLSGTGGTGTVQGGQTGGTGTTAPRQPATGTTQPPAATPAPGTAQTPRDTGAATPPPSTGQTGGTSQTGTGTSTADGWSGGPGYSGDGSGDTSATDGKGTGTTGAGTDSWGGNDYSTDTAKPASSRSSGGSIAASLPMIIGIIIGLLLILALIIFLASRRLGSSPNRVMAQVSSSPAQAAAARSGADDRFADHSRDLASYAAASSRQRTTPYENKPVRIDPRKPIVINPSGPLLLNLFVEDQNTAIGKRNIHNLKSGYGLSVGGGKGDDFYIFLVPIPGGIGELRRNGSQLSFIPRKPKYFPDLGSNELRDCLNKTIRIISDKNYEMRFRFEMYEDPLIALNRMLMSVKVPG
jgi:hypothetical protein